MDDCACFESYGFSIQVSNLVSASGRTRWYISVLANDPRIASARYYIHNTRTFESFGRVIKRQHRKYLCKRWLTFAQDAQGKTWVTYQFEDKLSNDAQSFLWSCLIGIALARDLRTYLDTGVIWSPRDGKHYKTTFIM